MSRISYSKNPRGVSIFSCSKGYFQPNCPEGDRLVSNDRKIRKGRAAAIKAYATPEIRQAIFSFVDHKTLAGMMRLEKAAVASVAAALYRRIPVSLVSKMSRANARRAKYCDAVQVIDRNPTPRFMDPAARYLIRPAPPKRRGPIRFDEVKLDKEIEKWRKKFPALALILHEYPEHEADDAYIVRMIDEVNVLVKLESHVDIVIPDFGDELLPKTPDWPGMEFKHTIALRLVKDPELAQNPFGFLVDGEELDEMEAWLYSPNLDRRVTSIDHSPVWREVSLTFEEAMALISVRKAKGCEPFTSFTLMDVDEPITADQLRQLTTNLGPQLCTLQLGGTVLEPFADEDELQTVIDIIDDTLPFLKKLVFLRDERYAPLTSEDAPVLFGLPNLHILEFTNQFESDPPNVDDLSKVVYQLGSPDCHFVCHGVYSIKEMKDFNARVRSHKIRPLIPMVRTQEFGRIGPAFPWYIPKSEVPAWNRSEPPESP